ncbi:MAG TPA: PEP-utilizing enzyme [Candidatus Limnocylindrales bacterium]|nr:PEP-utilizing enzyme [Candidatus Limnocylindrales bacterium]
MTTEAAPTPTDDFPYEFPDPSLAEIAWEWDDMHMPHAFTTLAGEFACDISDAFRSPYEKYPEYGPFPQRWYSAVWNGYVYYAYQRNVAEGDERKALYDRIVALCRGRIAPTAAYWRDELVPELQGHYAAIEAIPVDSLSLAELADAWEDAWRRSQRTWDIHFDVIAGPYQVLDDLVDAYSAVMPGAPAGEALRLAHGGRHELFDVEIGAERLAAMIAASPALTDALNAGIRSIDHLRPLPGGNAFAAAFEAFIAQHGHLGQSVDDLLLPSWREAPELLLGDLSKRIQHPPEPAEARRARLAAEADALADAVRARLADRPDDLAKFEETLAYARQMGFLTEVHNYWIDRHDQATMRTFALRVGRRMVEAGLLDRPEDIFHLHRAETAAALRTGTDQRPLAAERAARHEHNKTLKPPRILGKEPPPPPAGIGPDRFNGDQGASDDASLLKGTGSSAGVVRGPARVVLTSAEFDRIKPGDIIVCPSSNPSWVPVFTIAGGLVTNTGGVLSHAAVVAREFGLPAVTGVKDATTTIADGRPLEIDGTAGTVRLL